MSLRSALLGVALVALGTASASAEDKIIYTGVGSVTSEYWSDFNQGAGAVAKSVSASTKTFASEFQGQRLLEQFGPIFAQGCSNCAVAADPASNAFTKALVQRADKADAFIVTIWNRPDDIHPWDTAAKHWVAHTQFDGVDSGYRNGMALCKAIGGQGGIAALQGIPDNPSAKQRLAGLDKALAECPGMKLLSTQSAAWDQTKAQAVVRAWLAQYGDQIKGIFSSNDGMAIGAVAALKEAGLNGKVFLTGSDGSRDALELVKSGDMLSTMWVDPTYQGAIGTALAYAALVGDVDPAKLTHEQRDFYLKQTLVTKENAGAILDRKFDPSLYSYDKLKQNFWANVTGEVEPGANK